MDYPTGPTPAEILSNILQRLEKLESLVLKKK